MTITKEVRPTRRSRTQNVQLVALIFIGVFIIYRYIYEQPTNTQIVAACRNITNAVTADHNPRDGAFLKAADQARRDEDWGKKICPLQKLNDLTDFFEYIYTRRLSCDKPVMLGGFLMGINIDGDKWICLNKKMKISPRNCLVYSFGIGPDWSFEDEVERKLNCKVFAFDPTINVETHNRSSMISFFNLGISDITSKPDAKRKMDRYINILSRLGHVNSIIDILKIDVEGYELHFFKDVMENTPNLLKNVKLLSMEIHIRGRNQEILEVHHRFWRYFQLLDCYGFKIWYSAKNPITPGKLVNGRYRACCYEIVWVQDRLW